MQNLKEERELLVKENKNLSKRVKELEKAQAKSDTEVENLRAQLAEENVTIREAVSLFVGLTFLFLFISP